MRSFITCIFFTLVATVIAAPFRATEHNLNARKVAKGGNKQPKITLQDKLTAAQLGVSKKWTGLSDGGKVQIITAGLTPGNALAAAIGESAPSDLDDQDMDDIQAYIAKNPGQFNQVLTDILKTVGYVPADQWSELVDMVPSGYFMTLTRPQVLAAQNAFKRSVFEDLD